MGWAPGILTTRDEVEVIFMGRSLARLRRLIVRSCSGRYGWGEICRSPTRMRVNIVYRNNGQGLSRDARLLESVLSRTGHEVTLSGLAPSIPAGDLRFLPERLASLFQHATMAIDRMLRRRRSATPWDINLFLENIDRRYLGLATKNVFLPNQEWLSPGDNAIMASSIDLVLFKSRHAESRLAAETKRSRYIGFTSEDRRLPGVSTNWSGGLHIAGWNPHKGTARLLEGWSAHPDWPELVIVAKTVADGSTKNVRIIRHRVPNAALRQLQNTQGVHFCPSEVEGFGHSINEARSCGAVVVTTDAPPMNELITPANGLLVPYDDEAPMRRGTRFQISRRGLECVVRRLLHMSASERARLGQQARADYEEGRRHFERSLTAALADV